ncbi:MAG: hypothetical protein KF768_09065 [Phycisphaeraceae bacterium]|nr:hypothetical protein [Phycisphaeraceae bacterium]
MRESTHAGGNAGSHAGAGAHPNGHPHAHTHSLTATEVLRTRELYWHNVVREMLNGLSVLCQQQPEMFDGRFAVLTHAGERIAIGRIFPLFACSIPGSAWEREASIAVQCTIFRVITPDGEVFTLPVHEVRGMHSLTPELIEQLQKLAEAQQGGDGEVSSSGLTARPFGLAAFTALPRPANGENGGADAGGGSATSD